MRRRWLLIAVAAFGGLVVMAAVGVALFYGRIGAWVIEDKVVPRVEARLGRPIAIGAIDVGRGRVVLRDVVVPGDDGEPLVEIATITAEFAFWPSLRGEVELGEVVLDGVAVRAVRRLDGDNFGELVARLRGDGAAVGGPAPGGGGGPRPTAVVVRGGRIELRDERGGGTVIGEGIAARAEPGALATASVAQLAVLTGMGPYANLAGVELSASLDDPLATAVAVIGGGEVELWSGMSLSGVKGSVAQGERAGVLAIDLTGGYAGVEGTLWQARGWIDPRTETGTMRIAADRFSFRRIAPVLEGSAVIDYADTTMDAVVELSLDGDLAQVSGEGSIAGLNLFHPKLTVQPMRGLSGRGALSARYHRARRTLELVEARAATGGVEYILTGTLERSGGLEPDGQRRPSRRVSARLVVPRVGCQAMLDSIPPEFVPHLQGFRLKGTFSTDLRVAVDWADLEATTLDGSVGIRGCKVLDAPEDMDVRRLTRSFDHQYEVEEGVWQTMRIGPESSDFVALADVSPHLLNSLMTTEDSAFYKHKGFILREFRTALIKDLEAGYFKYGASSITMQMVKNVLLHRQKTLSRKFQELFLTWYLEQVLDKDRIFEIYVNAIEYGPGLYGIRPAARQYFGKEPRELGPTEAAFFSSILPAPKQRYVQFCKDKVTTWTHNKIQRILELMVKRDRLSVPEFEMAMVTPLVFQPDKSGFCDREKSKERKSWRR
jgi:hypothetical protein